MGCVRGISSSENEHIYFEVKLPVFKLVSPHFTRICFYGSSVLGYLEEVGRFLNWSDIVILPENYIEGIFISQGEIFE